MNFRGRGGFRPPFRGPGPGPRFMGGGGPPPRPLFFDGPPCFDGPPNFHRPHDDDFFDGPNRDFYDNGPPPPYFDGPPGPDFDEFPPYFEPEMGRDDVVLRDPHRGDFPPPLPTRRGHPRATARSQNWKEDRVLRNPHPHTSQKSGSTNQPSPKPGGGGYQPPKVNKVLPLMDIVTTPPVVISTPAKPSPLISSPVAVARVGPTMEVKTSPIKKPLLAPAKFTPPASTFTPRPAAPSVPAKLVTPTPPVVVSPLKQTTPSIPVPPTKLTPPPKPMTTSLSSTISSPTSTTPKLTTLPVATMSPKKEEPRPPPQKSKESKPHPVVSGVVTRMLTSSGVIDYKIFFDASTMVGPMPSVGDAVVVEVEPVTGLPFKLIGRRVQILSTLEQVLKGLEDEVEIASPSKNDAVLEEEYSKFLKDSNLTTKKTDNHVAPATTTAVKNTPVDETEIERLAAFRSHLAHQHRTLQFNLENADRLKRGLPPLPKPKPKKPKTLERDIARSYEHNKASLLKSCLKK